MEKDNAPMNFNYIPTSLSMNEVINDNFRLSFNSGIPQDPTCSSFARPLTLKETVSKLLKEGHQKDTNPETFKAALDAVRFEHQRLQNEYMSLVTLNEHVQQKLDALTDSNIKLELDLDLEIKD